MTGPNKPPTKGAKPFLGDEDLVSEIDAWDQMFDALHTEEKGGSPPSNEPVMEWPAPTIETPLETAIDPTALTQLPPDHDHGRTFDDDLELESGGGLPEHTMFGGSDPDVIETIDRGFGRPRASSAQTFDADPAETDFSGVGADGPPAALGGLLGRHTTAPPADDHGDTRETRLSKPRMGSQTSPGQLQRMSTGVVALEDDDGVFTSASRPTSAPPDPGFDDDALAPPPAPAPPVIARRPAIVRRTPLSVPIVAPPPADGDEPNEFSDFDGGNTRIQHVDEIEVQASYSRSAHQTRPPPILEDDYADIEIDAAADQYSEGTPEVIPDAASRRTAHVVRRVDGPSRPTLRTYSPSDDDDDPEMEMDVGESSELGDLGDLGYMDAPKPAGEDDFSDVAAEFGGIAEVPAQARITAPQPRQASAPRARRDSSVQEIVVIDDDDVGDRGDPPTPTPGGFDDMMGLGPVGPSTQQADFEVRSTTVGDTPRTVTPYSDEPSDLPPTGRDLLAMSGPAASGSMRPPALTDLYPRVKTPTSVPPLGAMAGLSSIPPVTARAPDPDGARPAHAVRTRLPTPIPVDIEVEPEVEPELDLEAAARAWPEQIEPLASATLEEASAVALVIYERELSTVDDSASSAALRVEAGRLCERLDDADRARSHYDAALLVDPRATAALRGLRRLARANGDLVEATRYLDAEIAVAGALERRPLGHYRIDLLMASGDQDLARVAVGEALDQAPSDVRALLAHLELAFLDGRADEFGHGLEQLAHAVTDAELRAAVQSARGALAAHRNDTAGAIGWFTAAAESDPTALAARIGAVRHAAAQADGESAARALVDLARQIETADPITAAAAAVRAQQWVGGETGAIAAAIATGAASGDPLVARLAAETAVTSGDAATTAVAFTHWANTAAAPTERAYAAARAAELDPGQGAELWAAALVLDPGDDYAAAQLRTSHVAADATQASIDVDLGVAADVERERARLRAAYGMIAQGQLEAAIEVLEQGRSARPGSLAFADALGEALAAAGRWSDRAKLFTELATKPGEQLDKEVAQLRSALAWEDAVGAAAEIEGAVDELARATISALEAWELVLEQSMQAPTAHAATIVLASRLGDRDMLADVLMRAQTAERSPWAATSLALRRARLYVDDSPRAEAIVRELPGGVDDPRRTVALVMAAARQKELGDASIALEERATLLEGSSSSTSTSTEVAALRLRAAQLALDAGIAAKATTLLVRVEQALPHLGVVPDLLAAARRRAGDRPTTAAPRRAEPQASTGASSADGFAREIRDGDLAAAHGDVAGALALYQRAFEMRAGDPLASVPLARVATQLRDPAPLASLALAQLRSAEEAGDGVAKALAYETLAQIDGDLRQDAGSAQIALESASTSDPTRIDLLHRLERHYSTGDNLSELIRLRKAQLEVLGADQHRDRAALLIDLAGLLTRDNRPELELADLYRTVLQSASAPRLALMHLEAIVRRSGFSEELAQLEEKIATYFEGDPRTQAAFWTRAGETLAEISKIDDAVLRFGRAEAALPGHVPALEGWRQAALKGQLWIDVAEAATRQAAGAPDEKHRGALHHFAGVALMDKALVGEQAMVAFRRALESDPGHRDAFLRLRILLEEDANHDDLATLLAKRLDVETDPTSKVELHRALAELHRNFLSDRDSAKEHFRAILEADPNDLRAHSAMADIAWEQGNWQEAADALMSRARLERQPEILKTLCFRLGLIYADRLVDVPMALKAFQRALTYQPDDENTLVRLADLATQVGEWKLALGACERLVKNETDPDLRAMHLQRVAKIFKDGFGDKKRAERALNLALDGAPTNDEALSQLVQFYRDGNDITSVRVHLNRVAGAMRARVAANPQDGIAYRVIARAMTARANAGVDGSKAIARAAAELAELLGASGEPEQKLIATPPQPELQALLRPEADEVLFPRSVQVELRQVFQLLGDRIAKHVGVDLRPYGATRGDRLRARDNPVAAVAQTIASGLGFGDIDVYLSSRQPWAMVAEPTSPVSLVIGQSIANAGGDAIRFAAGSALKLAQSALAIPARLPAEDLGVLVVALLRLFQPEFPILAVDGDAVATQTQKLRRLIPNGLMNELKPYALAIDPQRFGHRELSRDLKIAGLRAGLVASGSLLTGLRILAAQAEGELPSFLADPVAQGLISFALGEDHAVVAR